MHKTAKPQLRFTCTSYSSMVIITPDGYWANADLWHISKFECLVLQLLPSGFSNFQFRVLPNVESDSSGDLFGALHWGWVVPYISAPSHFCQEVGGGVHTMRYPCIPFHRHLWSCSMMRHLLSAPASPRSREIGHTFPSAVGVGITLGKLCSIYETSFGEVKARISMLISCLLTYILSRTPIWERRKVEGRIKGGVGG